ncbi:MULTISPECIES: orotidine-5'-phosphate decarboxylase [Gammaproteobacteria]|uniref:orotidine-5'-phosphate decarboxylase n=1 Tax=Gammaproteobacteria TaxID=1236 RepID=UPI000DCFADEA|nr:MULTISPECIES: orotidine-5'-phosphate decarboxylase [Gammaproteobacteria]RTE87290.1 orotidine-5'-phosphate decarboxylase [Aliidiomarina sp. B3213]TCZ92924.1 orotidine-5'-phosphate decarboxylase [Lysobacter sp. N42]
MKEVIVALDFPNPIDALAFADKLDPDTCRVKVGKELFTSAGPELVKELVARGFDVFLDLKFHDIPNTVAGAVRASAELGVWMVNVHASGGERMMRAAREALEPYGEQRPLLTAVTVLTSMSEAEVHSLNVSVPLQEQVLHLARLTKNSGLDGVVCSAEEARLLKGELGNSFKLVTPGIRPEGSAANDQTRVLTPKAAMEAGSDYLVIGRPIRESDAPAELISAINQQIS